MPTCYDERVFGGVQLQQLGQRAVYGFAQVWQ
jgi:hypothetical protein